LFLLAKAYQDLEEYPKAIDLYEILTTLKPVESLWGFIPRPLGGAMPLKIPRCLRWGSSFASLEARCCPSS